MPAGLYADWNDCLRLGANGESSFVALQFYYALSVLREFAKAKNDTDYLTFLDSEQEKMGQKIQDLCWDNDRFIRGFTEAGERIGAADDPEANMWLNPQSWAVISGFADKEQADLAMNNVFEQLNTDYGAILMNPPYHAHAFDGALAVIYNQGTKENSGIFSQSQGWLILAEALRGQPLELLPARHDDVRPDGEHLAALQLPRPVQPAFDFPVDAGAGQFQPAPRDLR